MSKSVAVALVRYLIASKIKSPFSRHDAMLPRCANVELFVSVSPVRTLQIAVTVAGLTGEEPVQCSRNVVIRPDASLEAASKQVELSSREKVL